MGAGDAVGISSVEINGGVITMMLGVSSYPSPSLSLSCVAVPARLHESTKDTGTDTVTGTDTADAPALLALYLSAPMYCTYVCYYFKK